MPPLRAAAAARAALPAQLRAAPRHRCAALRCGGFRGRGGGERRAATVVASERAFAATRALTLPLRSEHPAFPVERYLQNAERVVHLSFPDSHRRQRVSGDTWRVQLLPLQFLWLTLRVSCTLRAWPDAPGALAVAGREMRVDGLPPDLAGMANSIALRVDGGLRSSRPLAKDSKAPPGAIPAATALQGRVSLRISADIPPIIALTPGLDAVVGSILEAILSRLEAALRRGLLDDYDAWVREQKAAQHAVLAAAAAAAKRETQP